MSSQVVPAGKKYVEVARALESLGQSLGTFPYQWSRPGPNSSVVMEQATLDINIAAGVYPIVSYQVPDGMRFSLTGFIVDFLGTGWVPGSSDLLFTLNCVSAGSRAVDYLRNLNVAMGDLRQGPFPIAARLEFQPLDVLTWNLTQTINILPGAGQVVFAQIYGHLYPQTEAAI